MPNTTTAPKAPQTHPGRNAGERPPAQPTSASEPREPRGPFTAFSGEAERLAVEGGIHTLLDLGAAREDLAWEAEHRLDDLMTTEQRRRAVADLERIIGELAGGLARAIRRGRVSIEVEETAATDRAGRMGGGIRTPA
ncbi:MAG: hypothetical protein RIB58_06105 [Phycisphaerales bacterium]